MADNQIIHDGISGLNYYYQIRDTAAKVYNGSTFETYSSANWSTYALSLTEQTGSSNFVATFPTLSPGNYTVSFYLELGSSPASGDVNDGNVSIPWNGSAFTSLPVGDGFVPVNHNYGSTGAYIIEYGNNTTIGGASINAYRTSELTSSPSTAVLRGQTVSMDDGTWASSLLLGSGIPYTIVVKIGGQEAYSFAITPA